MNWFDGLRRRNGNIIASNLIMESILKSREWVAHMDLFPCYTGTVVIYEKKDTPFSDRIISNNIIFRIPAEYMGLINTAIVMQHPDFELRMLQNAKNGSRFLLEGQISEIVYAFPKSSGWYLSVSATGMPAGKKIRRPSRNSRHIWRKNGPYIGPVVRNTGHWKSIHLDKRPTKRLSISFMDPSEQYRRQSLYPMGKLLR